MSSGKDYLALPAPHDPDDHSPHGEPRGGRSRRRRKIPSREEIYDQVLQLIGLVVMGYTKSSQANVILKGLKMILDGHYRDQHAGGPGEDQQNLAELCRKDPQLLKMVEGLLTDEQVAWVLEGLQPESGPDIGDE